MKWTLLLFIVLFSCTTTKVQTSSPSSYSVETKKSFDESWTNIIDFISARGISIKTIDKASGIIVSDDYSFLNSYTFEGKENKDAYVILNKIRGGFGNTLKPTSIIGNFNIRVKQVENGTSITVNLVNLKGYLLDGNSKFHYYKVRSTNAFEKMIAMKLE